MEEILLKLPHSVHTAIWSHLLSRNSLNEEAAFMYVQQKEEGNGTSFHYLDWLPVTASGFVTRSPYYLELTDQMRATVIKKAHDLKASIVELHSHGGQQLAEFSESDLLGFQEFVPHVWWRLKGRPYIAVVVSNTSFDALAWVQNAKMPQRLSGITTENLFLKPTNLTLTGGNNHEQ